MKTSQKWLVVGIVILIALLVISQVTNLTGNAVKDSGAQVVLHTTQGDIVIELYENTPITSGNFKTLVSQGFYDGVRFHRVIDGFMIQGGDPLSKDVANKARWGTGGSEAIVDEFAEGASNVRGTISMANAGPNTGSSQFFINLKDNTFLDGRHAVFGVVNEESMKVVDAIARTQTDARDAPIEDVVIEKAEIR